MTFPFLSSYLLFPNQTDPNSKAACPVTGHLFLWKPPTPAAAHRLAEPVWVLDLPLTQPGISFQTLFLAAAEIHNLPSLWFLSNSKKGILKLLSLKISFPTWLRNCRKDLFPSDGGRSAARAAQGVRERKDRRRKTITCCSNRVECFRARWQATAATSIN